MSPKKEIESIGLDISAASVKAAAVKSEKGVPVLTDLAMIGLPEGIVVDGEVMDANALTSVLKELWGKNKIKGKKVHIGLANQKVIVRPIELPYMETEELESAIKFQAQEFIPIPIDEAVLAFEVIEEFMTPEEERMLTILLVAAHKEMVLRFVDAVEGAGLSPVSADLKAFALPRSLLTFEEQMRTMTAEEEGVGICIVNVGAGITNIVIMKDYMPHFARIILKGGDDFTGALTDRMDIAQGEAELIRMGQMEAGADANEVLRQEVANFVGEIRRSIDYYVAQTQERNIVRLILCGEGSQVINLPQEISRGLRLPVELGQSFQNVKFGKLPYTPEKLAEVEPQVAVSIGLALKGVQQ